MPGYRATQIRAPANETEFEKNCVVLFCELLGDPNVKRVGTKGQSQHGLDIIGHRNRDPKQIVGIQCKLKSGKNKLTKTEAEDEIDLALGYKPPISEYFIVTTSKDDVALLQYAQERMLEQESAGRRIHIEIWGWDTLQERIDQYESAKQAFDPGFSPSIAAQDRNLEALLAGQRKQATKAQVDALAESIQRNGEERTARLPAKYADRELKESLTRIMRRRGFSRTNTSGKLSALASRAIDGDLVLGSAAIRAEICDRAARSNAVPATAALARRFRDCAAQLDSSRDLFLADALLLEADGDPDSALRQLKTRLDKNTRSALMTLLIRQRGVEAALNWVKAENLGPRDFNPPGATNLILKSIENGEFDRAFEQTAQIPDGYFNECPALRLLRAQLTIAAILPVDQKAALFQGLPLNPKILQLASGSKAKQHIKLAVTDLRALLAVIDELDLDYLRSFLTEFELWLRLEDNDTRDAARSQLAAEIADNQTTLQRVRLALAYDVAFNQEALERHLTARKELGGWSSDERFAAFLMAYHSRDAKKISEFFDRHHDDLFSQSDIVRSALAGIEIEIFARTGRFEEAKAHIRLHKGKDLTEDQARDIEDMVAHIEKGDEVESLRQRYEDSKTVGDLRILVGGLRARREAEQLAIYSPTLARATKTIEDFGVAITALFQSNKDLELVRLTADLPELLELDDELSSIKGWALFRLGRVMEARAIARSLMKRRGATNDRELSINTAIESGDWGYVQALLADEASHADTIPANDLIRLSRLALEVNSPYVDHFRDAALRKAPDDPEVNMSAYMLATERGEEYRGTQAHEWFQKAVKLSGPQGPVRSVSMREMIDHASGWNERTENVDKLLRRAEVPLFVVAKALRRQLIDLMLGQALRNTDTANSRLKFPVFAFFGAHATHILDKTKSTVLDVTCLITLDYLGLLEKVVQFCDRLIVAPSTLSTLFVERQFLRVQQPSEIAKAQRIQALVAAGSIKVVTEDSEPPARAAKEIGRDLATLLAVARRDGGFVVRSAPVSKVGTFLEEHADMSGYAAELSDTLSALAFLSQGGKIDAPTKQVAEAYLRQVDKGWKPSASITAESKLYLDDLTVTYLDHVGLLDVLIQSVAAVYVHQDLDTRTRQILHHGEHASELLNAIDRIRAVVSGGLESGKITFSSRRAKDDATEEDEADSLQSSPSLDVMSNLSDIEAIIVDDRCLNRLPIWTDGRGKSAKAATTLELLTALNTANELDKQTYWRCRHKLRAAGYYAVPVEAEELQHHLATAPVEDKKIRETPELRAVRESAEMALINNAFISPEERWVNGLRFAVVKAIRRAWIETKDNDQAEACANWLLSILPNPMEWCLQPENDTVWAAARQQASTQAGLLMFFVEGTPDQRRRYFSWLKESVIDPLRKGHRELWDTAIDFLKSYMARLMETDNET